MIASPHPNPSPEGEGLRLLSGLGGVVAFGMADVCHGTGCVGQEQFEPLPPLERRKRQFALAIQNPIAHRLGLDSASARPAQNTPFALSLSKPVLSACLGRQSKGAVLFFVTALKEEEQPFDKLSANGI